jgi:hypothetical protein
VRQWDRQRGERSREKKNRLLDMFIESLADSTVLPHRTGTGLLIVEAHYGDLGSAADSGDEGLTHVGRSIDVTVPLQMLVDDANSQLVIHGGQSKSLYVLRCVVLACLHACKGAECVMRWWIFLCCGQFGWVL